MARSNLIPNAFIWETFCIKYQKPSWPVTFYPMPLIWTATHPSKHLFLRNHWAVWWIIHYIVLVNWPKCLQSPYMVRQIGSIISCSWLWPILTLLRRSGERLRTFRPSSWIYTQSWPLRLGLKVRYWNCADVSIFFIELSTKTYLTGVCYDLNDTVGELRVR